MIVYTHEDLVRLSGSLVKNQWLTIKAAANLLLRDHPQGIVIDCSELTQVSEEGAKTFLEAMRDIQHAGSRMIVANLPDDVLRVIRAVPGVRSQLPIASSIEEARASLKLAATAPGPTAAHASPGPGVLVPLFDTMDLEYAVTTAGRLARADHLSLHLVALLVVARNLPVGTPLPEQETAANQQLETAGALARKFGVPVARHMERVRDIDEGLLHLLKQYNASHVVVAAQAARANDEPFVNLVEALLHRAPCNVLVCRRAPSDEQGTGNQ